ncbi:MAG: alpha/beta hydrolase [Proteobacteria bacterium]|nr:alpha/beta hydrolase [Pseudomonadota bacterium]
MTTSQGLFKASDGTSLFFEVQGEGKPLVFCYGLTCRRDHWRHQIAYFAKNYQIITFDYRGHHNSSRPLNDQHLTLDWCANDLVDLFNHLRIQEAVVLGHSLGVSILSKFVPKLQERIKAAVFICGSVTNPFENMFHSNRMSRVHSLTTMINNQAPTLMSFLWQKFTERNRLSFLMTSRLGFNASKAEEQDVLNYMDGVNRTPFPIFYSLISDYAQFDGRPLLKRIECPTLVLAGEEDHITPYALQEEIAELLPMGQLIKISGGSHNAHMDFPDKVNHSIDSFLADVGFK